jgi:hypothetical protein
VTCRRGNPSHEARDGFAEEDAHFVYTDVRVLDEAVAQPGQREIGPMRVACRKRCGDVGRVPDVRGKVPLRTWSWWWAAA